MGAFYRQNLTHTLQTLAFAVIFLACSIPAYAQDITSNLVGHWKLDETAGTPVIDSTGSFNGTWNGSLNVQSVDGKINSAFDFTADTNYIDLGNPVALRDIFPLTVAAWIYPRTYNCGGFGICNVIYTTDEATATPGGWSFSMNASGNLQMLREGIGALSISNEVVPLEQWTHVAMQWNPVGFVDLFINGTETTYSTEVSAAWSSDAATQKYIGAMRGDLNMSMDGFMDDVRIYNRILTSDDLIGLATSFTEILPCNASYEATMTYNNTENIMQYCNGTDWINMGNNGAEGSSSGTCSNPNGVPGEMTYNTTEAQMQYCNGVNWVAIGPDIGAGTPTSGLAGHWTLDDAIASGIAAEEISANNGTVAGTITFGPTTGQLAGAALFPDGAGNYIAFPDVPALKPSPPLTISTWWKPVDITESQDFLQTEDWATVSGSYYGAILAYDNTGDIRIAYGDGAGSAASNHRTKTASFVFANDTWYHITGVIRGAADMDIYVNGVDIGGAYSGTGGAIAYAAGTGKLGSTTAANNIDGYIDDPRIYNRALTEDEIESLYAATGGTASLCTSPNGTAGEIIYNDTQNIMQYCAGSSWVAAH